MIITNREKFRKLFASPDDTHFVSLSAPGTPGINKGYLNSALEVQAEVLHYAFLHSVKQVEVSFSRNIMADPDETLTFTVSYIVNVKD